MKFLKQSRRDNPKVSLILLDWSVRESFHLLHYLSRQNVSRDRFEVIIIEYYSRVSDAIRQFEDQVDTWVLLEMPEDCYYHKHLMYNAGIVLSRGEICVICDSDAMVKEGFIKAIIEEFEKDPEIVLHLDQFRNMRRDFYPFNYPSFEDVLGQGCINNVNGKTKGIVDIEDPVHTRNYGACMCARREDLIAIGGADEHIDYLGHICGPYDMTFRLVNHGRREIWHPTEFMFHTWHPGQAGVDNYLGPHDGRHVSTTALDALKTGRVMPLVENPAIGALRTNPIRESDELFGALIRDEYAEAWKREYLNNPEKFRRFDTHTSEAGSYRGFRIYNELGFFYAHPMSEPHVPHREKASYRIYVENHSIDGLKEQIDAITPRSLKGATRAGAIILFASQASRYAAKRLGVVMSPAWRKARRIAEAARARVVGRFMFILRRLGQFREEKATLSGGLEALIYNLYFMKAELQTDSTGAVLLVDQPAFKHYLRLLMGIRLIPSIPVIRVRDQDHLLRVLNRLNEDYQPRRLIVAGSLYTRFYATFAAHQSRKNALVI